MLALSLASRIVPAVAFRSSRGETCRSPCCTAAFINLHIHPRIASIASICGAVVGVGNCLVSSSTTTAWWSAVAAVGRAPHIHSRSGAQPDAWESVACTMFRASHRGATGSRTLYAMAGSSSGNLSSSSRVGRTRWQCPRVATRRVPVWLWSSLCSRSCNSRRSRQAFGSALVVLRPQIVSSCHRQLAGDSTALQYGLQSIAANPSVQLAAGNRAPSFRGAEP